MIEHKIIKDFSFVIITTLYLLFRKNEYIFNIMFYIIIIGLFIVGLFGGIKIINNSWWSNIPFVLYSLFFVLTYYTSLNITNSKSYSLALSINLITMNGYLYELGRFIKHTGLNALRRYTIDRSIFSLPIFFLLLMKQDYNIKKLFFPIVIYIIYVFNYYNPYMLSIKRWLGVNIGLGFGMSFYRLITLTLSLIIVMMIDKKVILSK